MYVLLAVALPEEVTIPGLHLLEIISFLQTQQLGGTVSSPGWVNHLRYSGVRFARFSSQNVLTAAMTIHSQLLRAGICCWLQTLQEPVDFIYFPEHLKT